MKRKRYFRSALALLLAAAVTLCPLTERTAQAAAGTGEERTEAFLTGLFGRFEQYLDGKNRYDELTDAEDYLHCIWADEIERMTERVSYESEEGAGFFEKMTDFVEKVTHNAAADIRIAFTWAGHVLTDTELDEEAYVEYLSRILAMHEKGFLETAMTQAEYSIRVSTGEEIREILKTAAGTAGKLGDGEGLTMKISEVFGKDVCEKVEKTLKGIKDAKKVVDLASAISKETKNLNEIYALASYANLHRERLGFLEAIREYADEKEQKNLSNAAYDLIEASNMRVAGLLMADPAERAKNISKFMAAENGGWDLEECVDQLTEYISVCTGALAAEVASGAGAFLLKGVSCLTANASLITAGFTIGGHLGRIFMGDEYERYREMLIMDEIGGVLAMALPEYERDYQKAKGEDDRYEAVYGLVSAGEALCYVRLRGEFCVFEYARGKKGAPDEEEMDWLYSRTTERLNRRYMALAAVFPEPPSQVTVYAEQQREETVIGPYTAIKECYVPTVSIEGNDAAAEKINESRKLAELLESADAEMASVTEYAQEMAESEFRPTSGGGSVHVWLEDVHATVQALSLRFKRITSYVGSAHPNHAVVCMNYDTSTGEWLRLEDLLNEERPDQAKEELKALLIEAMNTSGNPPFFRKAQDIVEELFGTDSESLRERHWYFSSDGFHIVFDPYEIAPYAAGSLTYSVPYYRLKGILKDEYLPEELGGVEEFGQPEIWPWDRLKTGKGYYDPYQIQVYGVTDGSLWAAVTEKTAYQVQVVTGSNVVFYANRMTPNDVVWLRDRWEQDLEFVVSYYGSPMG